MHEGQYIHINLKSIVEIFIAAYKENSITDTCIKLMLSVDGAPLAKVSEKGLWIISISEITMDLVEVAGIYHGLDKPKDFRINQKDRRRIKNIYQRRTNI